MKRLRVLHLASFEGNIGDNANHAGARMLMKVNINYELEYTNLEIREFYWKHRRFDNEFVQLANSHDLVIIGGGNYFELWVESSCTGTSIDISEEILKAIKTPILFYSLGCDPGQGIPEGNLEKFKRFLSYLNNSPKYLVSVRNDGSYDTIQKHLGEEFSRHIHKVPDGGFFIDTRDYYHPEISNYKKVIGINLAGDMLDSRYDMKNNNITYSDFVTSFTEMLNRFMESDEDIGVVFIPHIFRDISPVYDILSGVKDIYRRKRISVAPYIHGEGSQDYIFDLYKKCNLVLGTRFHSNVCSIGLGIPTIGLVNYIQIENLYKELGIIERTVKVNEPGFEKSLEEMMHTSLRNINEIRAEYQEIKRELTVKINSFHKGVLQKWLEQNIH